MKAYFTCFFLKKSVVIIRRQNIVYCIIVEYNTVFSLQKIVEERYHIIYSSPEAALTNYRSMIKAFKDTLVAVAIDESHCIEKW